VASVVRNVLTGIESDFPVLGGREGEVGDGEKVLASTASTILESRVCVCERGI
jgi:hypothetical protein